MSLNVDRSKWTKVKFGDVVTNVNENVKDPSNNGIERSLGLEHLDPRELKIARWGSTRGGGTFTRRVKPGQTLFGKRRAYQRKTAYAEFDAVCSGDILVFSSKDPSVLLPDLLPFLTSTDAFYDHALQTSAGSLSPRTKWTDLAKYEFLLPPIEEQRRIADLMWSVEECLWSLKHRLRVAAGTTWNDPNSTRLALLNHLLAEANGTSQTATLSEIGTLTRGRRFTKKDYVDSGIGSIHYAEIHTHYEYVATEVVKFVPTEMSPSLRFAQTGDLVIAGTSETADDVCKAVAWLGANEVAVHDDCFILRHGLDPSYASLLFASADFQRQKARFVSESKVVRVSSAGLEQITVPVPPRGTQERIVGAVGEVDRAIDQIREDESRLKRLQRGLLEELLGGQS